MIGAILGGIGLGLQAFGMFSAASAARSEGKRQAILEGQKTQEELRRTTRENVQVQALTKAIMGASGTTGTGSQTYYLRDMQAEQKRELDWIRKVGASNANSIRRSGNALAQQHSGQAFSSIFQAGATLFGGD